MHKPRPYSTAYPWPHHYEKRIQKANDEALEKAREAEEQLRSQLSARNETIKGTKSGKTKPKFKVKPILEKGKIGIKIKGTF